MLVSNNYIQILKSEFDKKVDKNPRYSLRAFAKHLEISPASLSNVLSGKKGLSERVAKSISEKLGFNAEESEFFCALVNSFDARSKEKRDLNKKFVSQYLKNKRRIVMGDEAEDFVSDIRNFVILELLKITKVKAPLQKNLLSSSSVPVSIKLQQEIINRMISLGIVEVVDGFFQVKHETFMVPDKIAAKAQKKVHMKALELAKEAYESVSYDEREFYLIVTPINSEKMNEIKSKIREFADNLMYEYGEPTSANSVYGLCSYFFPLEKLEK